MAKPKAKKQIVLDEGTEAVVRRGGITVRFNAGGGIDVYGNVPVTLHPTANAVAAPRIGDRMEDGTIFAGVSPDTGHNMFVTPQDATGAFSRYGTFSWYLAMEYAANLHAHGHKDWKLPTGAELEVLYENRSAGALKGTFNERGSYPSGWYWSAIESPNNPNGAWTERFSDGHWDWHWKDGVASLRPVRSQPRP